MTDERRDGLAMVLAMVIDGTTRKAVEGTEAELRRAFRDAYVALENRIKLFVALPIEKLDRMAIKRNVDEIGRHGAAPRLQLP